MRSYNTLYANLMMDVGPANATEAATRYGIMSPLKPVPSAVLGSNDVTAMDMAAAFSTFTNRGIRVPPVLVTRITRADGTVLFTHEHTQAKVLEAGVADTVTGILEQVVERGTGTKAQLDRPAAGKTGTTDDHRDAWFVGYTPELATSVWVGFPKLGPPAKGADAAADHPDPGHRRLLPRGGLAHLHGRGAGRTTAHRLPRPDHDHHAARRAAGAAVAHPRAAGAGP